MNEKNSENLNKKGKIYVGIGLFLLACMVALIAFAAIQYFSSGDHSSPLSGKFVNAKREKNELKGAIDNFPPFGSMLYYNGGKTTSDNSLLREKYGDSLTVDFVLTSDFGQQMALLQSDKVDFTYTTVDLLSVNRYVGNSADESDIVVFAIVVDSRGGDMICADASITSFSQLKGKTIACARQSPSSSMLYVITDDAGLKMGSDFTVQWYDGAEQVKNAYLANKSISAAVLWSPYNQACETDRPGTQQLVNTKSMPFFLTDCLIAKRSVLEKKKDLFVKLVDAWLEANALVQNKGAMKEAALAYQKAWGYSTAVAAVEGNEMAMKDFYYPTISDNRNYFKLAYSSGRTGEDLYLRMANYYYPDREERRKKVVPWNKLAYTDILESSSLELDDYSNRPNDKLDVTASQFENGRELLRKPYNIEFPYNSAELTSSQKTDLIETVRPLIQQYSGMLIVAEGNTDNYGSREYNMKLSDDRAYAAIQTLIDAFPDLISSKQCRAIGNGPDKPIASNKTAEGRQKNRRTELVFLAPE